MTPADPTPSAAVAPTGGETVTRYDLCCGEESAWLEPGPTGAYVLFEDVRAALSSPVRAEPIDAGTWRTMYEAWRKRAEEAERELMALQPSAASPLSSPLSPLSPEQRAALADFTATMQNEVIPALVAKRRRAGVRAALSSPVRAEPTGYSGSTGEALDVLATAERHIPEAERGYYILAIDTLRSSVRAEPTDLPIPDAELLSRAASWLVADDGGSPYTHDLIAMLAHRVEALLESPARAERGEAERDALDARRYRFLRDNPLGLRAVDGSAAYPPATAENFDWYVDDAMAPTPPATPTEPTDA